jgi:ATP-dependent helicase/nuclease subunit A
LQFCDFDRALSLGIKNEIARLTEERFIAPGYAELIDEKQIEGFFESPLFKRIHSAKRIWREQRFNLFLPASDFTRIEEKSELLKDETIAVQGVIDIFFEDENGRIVLCDYKTDYLTREEISEPTLAAKKLSKRHGEQLSYYAKAVEAMLERAPDEIIIYSLPLKDQINVIQGE